MNFDADKRYFLNGPLGHKLCLALTGDTLIHTTKEPPFKNNTDFSESPDTQALFAQLRAGLLSGDAEAWQIGTQGGHPNGFNLIGMLVDDGRTLSIALGYSPRHQAVLTTPLTSTPGEHQNAQIAIARALAKKTNAHFDVLTASLEKEGILTDNLPVVDLATLLVEAKRRELIKSPRASEIAEKSAAETFAKQPDDHTTAENLAVHALAKTTPSLKDWAVAIEVVGGDAHGLQQHFIPVGVGLSRKEAADTLVTWKSKNQHDWAALYKLDPGPSESPFPPEKFGRVVAMPTESLPLNPTFLSHQIKPNPHHVQAKDSPVFLAALAQVKENNISTHTAQVITGVLATLDHYETGVAVRVQLDNGTSHRLTARGNQVKELAATPLGTTVSLLVYPAKNDNLGRVVAVKTIPVAQATNKDKGAR